MKQKRSLVMIALIAFLVGGGMSAGATVAVADMSSSTVCWYPGTIGYGRGYEHYAFTRNSASTQRGGGVSNSSRGTGCGGGLDVENIGAAGYLKRTNGTACSTASVQYVTAGNIIRHAAYSSSACGTGVQLQGTGTSYGYNDHGTGYASASIAAPFQNF